MKPPRLPLGRRELELPKRRPPPVLGSGCEDEGPQSFSMCTPRGGPDDTTRHYIGTPRADSILSAFMDFGDACGGEDQGPPLDFDDAFEAFQKREKAEASKAADGVKAKVDAGGASPGPLGSSGASTRCSLSDDDECAKSDEDMRDLAKQDEEDDEASDYDSDEEYYESDFEDYESDYSDEEDLEPSDPAAASDTQGRAASRTRSSSRAGRRCRSSSRGGLPRDESRPRRRDRSESRPRGHDAAAQRRERSGSRTGRRRDTAQGGAQRDRSLDRLRKAMAQPLRPMGIPPLP